MPVVLPTPFGFSVDLTFWSDLFAQPTGAVINSLYAIVGWTILALIFFFMGAELWAQYRTILYTKKWKWVLLAVDIPPLYIQTPKAVEQIFAHLSGAKVSINVGQKYWLGKKQKWFSLEIVSLEGYIQFLIRCEAEYRDLVEAAIYAQYAEAEITEVEDYVDVLANTYPNEKTDMFAVEFALASDDAFPIRTYPSFEYNISKDLVFSDPMAAILENFSRIGKGENLLFQIIVEPTSSSWKEKGIELVKKIVANKKESHEPWYSKIGEVPKLLAEEAIHVWEWNFPTGDDVVKAKEAPAGKVSDLTPGSKDTVQAIEEKISKIGFKTKIRIIYTALKEVYNPGRCIDGFVGALNQFHIMSRNAIVPHGDTILHYAFKQYRTAQKKMKYAGAFKKRKIKSGCSPYILNIEELATLWHFPLPFVKTPLLQKAETKRGEPPMNLPLEVNDITATRMKKVVASQETVSEPDIALPEDLPFG